MAQETIQVGVVVMRCKAMGRWADESWLPVAALPAVPAPTSVDLGDRPEQRVPMSRLRARVAERLLESQATNAILTTFNEVNMQPVMDLRNKYKDKFEKEHGAKLGFMGFFVKAAVAALKKYPVLKNVWVAMDRLKLGIERPPDHEEQMKYYNGWKHDHYNSTVIYFAPHKTIPCAYLNCPGSLHVSNVARQGGLYIKLEKMYDATGRNVYSSTIVTERSEINAGAFPQGVYFLRIENAVVRLIKL